MHPILTLLLQIITLPILSCWFGFSLWALIFGMTLTGGLGLLVMPLFLQPWLPKNLALRWNLWGLVVPLLMWQIGWKEYRTQRIEFGCTAHQIYHALHTDIPGWCPASFHTAIDDWDPTSLYKPSERVAIWLHHLGETWYVYSIGLKQRSTQLRRLHTALPTLPSTGPLPPKQLRIACNPQGPKIGTLIQLQSSKLTSTDGWIQWRENNSDTLSDLAGWEQLQRTLMDAPSEKSLHKHSILRPRSTVSLNKTRTENIWSVTQPVLHTITPAQYHHPSWLIRSLRIPLDNSMYCGLQMEGWLFPYRELWNWTEPASNF